LKRKEEKEDTEFCCKILCYGIKKKSGEDKPIRKCYEWQVGKLKVESWVGRLQKTKHNWTSLPMVRRGGRGNRNKKKVPLY